ncbi:DNA-binding protein [Romboutsia ilealis]|uniref:DNA-binding protein n=1 Tax=Romboutsia faecis TaxID=2764597 RepID=A0ABR7JP50_9FIRM|nr:Mor transcription activator family protein [Romboutsia faecis]MBC5996548.1 DNA-binding protein [Romboutsia faecis]MRN24074.1 DNA-binding protein [Romboutsia ilealis]
MLEEMTRDDLPEGVMDIVDTIGIDAFKDLVRLVGGSNLYIPNESSLVKSYRNKMIRKEFKGDYRSISRKFGISEVQVRNIINLKLE